ncbi:MAG: hypothetical protein OXD30_04490 [Bryobacterales bacterium]|nr:hypothetical protein [Bryobacterales bacterium]
MQQRNQELLQNPFGKRSEKQRAGGATGAAPQPRPAGAGPQPGAAAHGRLDRSPLEVQEEVHEPPPERRVCAACGRAYVRNGAEVSERIEVQVRGYVRRIRRPRYRAVCDCAQRQGPALSPAIAELEPVLFRGANYGLSVWVEFLLQVYWQRCPVRAFEREWGACGVRLPVSTLLGHLRAFLTWFEPLEMALEQHQQQALSAACAELFEHAAQELAALQGRLLSVLTTLDLAGIDLRRWLAAFRSECARIGRNAVVRQPQAWLPWGLPAPRRQALLAAERAAPPEPDP